MRRLDLSVISSAFILVAILAALPVPASAQLAECTLGLAAGHPCENVDLMDIVPTNALIADGSSTADMWGWTDPETGREYAIVANTMATAFVDVTIPDASVFVGYLPGVTDNILWRDLKVYDHYVYIVGDSGENLPVFAPEELRVPSEGASTSQGLQIMDLHKLRGATPGTVFTQDGHYNEFGDSHNLVINEETGFLYAVASDTCGAEAHVMDVATDPLNPTFVGCIDTGLSGAWHDAQCVVYRGPDLDHNGREICFVFQEDRFTIVDVEDKDAHVVLGNETNPLFSYVHQGWLTEDHQYLLSNDETDELFNGPHPTHTYMWDVRDLDAPNFLGTYNGPSNSIDHNLYIRGNHAIAANYTEGLRILDISDLPNGNLTQVGFFDIHPASDVTTFAGSWSNYAFFPSGTIGVSVIENGLYVLRPHLGCGAQPIFSDYFETGEAPPAWDRVLNPEGRLTLTDAKGSITGQHSLEVGIMGTANRRPRQHQVVDWLDEPVDEVCLSFNFNPNNLAMVPGSRVKVWAAKGDDRQRLMHMDLRLNSAGEYRVRLRVHVDGNLVSTPLSDPLNPDSSNSFEIYWKRSDGSGNGELVFTVNGQEVFSSASLDNDSRALLRTAIGYMGLARKASTGSIIFDDYVSRTSLP